MTINVPSAPNQYHTVTPYLTVTDGNPFIAFVETVFNGRVTERINRSDSKIAHADMRIGDATIMLTDASDDWPALPVALYVYVHDTDITYAKALASGAQSIMSPANQFHGDRMAGVRDPFGNTWWLVTHIETVKSEDLQRRFDAEIGKTP